MRRATVAAFCCGVSIQISAQVPAQPADELRFEVASIRPSGPDRAPDCQPPTCYTSYYRPLPGRFSGNRMSVLFLIATAYSMPMNRLVGPDWTRSEQYDIEATHSLPASDEAGVRAMLQRLLQERFALQIRQEQRLMPVYVLAKARDDGRLGPQLVSIRDCTETPGFLPAWYQGCGQLGIPSATSRLGRGTWAGLALHRHLEQSLDALVVDETGLSGWFAALLEWSDPLRETSQSASTPPSNHPPLATALREQLGLKLERRERPVGVIVVDRVERPTPN